LNIRFIDEFIELKLGLLITVDCGISCAQEVKKASDNGISVIITDHHTIPEQKPEAALAIIHPLREDCSYPFKGLTGAAVSYKLAQALLLENLEREQALEMIDDLSDLSSLGTVADCGHLIGENRAIVSKGLRKLQNSKWNGIKALLEISGLTSENINASSIGFKIAPRINAAGRIDNPLFALQMLLIEDDEAKVSALAQKLEQINQKRQKMLEVALQKALSNDSHTVERVIIDSNPDWHVGILGLIAGRLAGDTGKPAIMMQDMGDRLVGSARSNESFNVVEALTAHSELLDHFGGHHQAAGFDLKKENLEKFVKSMRAYAAENLKNTDLKPTLNLDCLLSGEEINWENWELLEKMAPFGYGNEEPVFIMENVRPQELSIVGKTKEHLSMKFVFNNQEVRSIAFKMGEFAEFVRQKDTIDLACKIQKNVWRDKASLQMQIIDIR
jgi:single-stranded-DNA-specific exonuclease